MLQDLSKYKQDRYGEPAYYYLFTNSSYLKFYFDKFFMSYNLAGLWDGMVDINSLQLEKQFNSVEEEFADIEKHTDKICYVAAYYQDEPHLLIATDEESRHVVNYQYIISCEYKKANQTVVSPCKRVGFGSNDFDKLSDNLRHHFQYAKVYSTFSQAIDDPIFFDYKDILNAI